MRNSEGYVEVLKVSDTTGIAIASERVLMSKDIVEMNTWVHVGIGVDEGNTQSEIKDQGQVMQLWITSHA